MTGENLNPRLSNDVITPENAGFMPYCIRLKIVVWMGDNDPFFCSRGDRRYYFDFLCLKWADFSGFVRNLKIMQRVFFFNMMYNVCILYSLGYQRVKYYPAHSCWYF